MQQGLPFIRIAEIFLCQRSQRHFLREYDRDYFLVLGTCKKWHSYADSKDDSDV
jgi:hypothetical protein